LTQTIQITGCTPCCGSGGIPCGAGYLKDLLASSSACSRNEKNSPVTLLAEFTVNKAGATWHDPALASHFPASFSAKLTSPGYDTNKRCENWVDICSGYGAYGDFPAWPDFRLNPYMSAGFFLNGSPMKSVNSIYAHGSDPTLGTKFMGVRVGSTEYGFTQATCGNYMTGQMPVQTLNCATFEAIYGGCIWGVDSAWGTLVPFTVRYTFSTPCVSLVGSLEAATPHLIHGKSYLPMATPVVSQATTPCKHLGANIQDPASCNCGTAILRHCSVYGACRVTGISTAGEGICLTCPDYQSP